MTAVIVTRHGSRVDHLGVYVYDPNQPPDTQWPTGRHVPICGTDPDRWHVSEYPEGRADGVKRKPLCPRCRAHLTDLVELATRREPQSGPRPRSGQAGTAIPHAVCP